MEGDAVALSALAIMGTIVGVLVWLLKKLFNQNDTTLKESNKTQLTLAKSIDKLATASEKQIESGKARDVEQQKFQLLVIEKLEDIDTKADIIKKAVSNTTVQTQNVETQVIKHEVVEGKP